MYLEYSATSVTRVLYVVRDAYKKSLRELLATRGTPKMGDESESSPPGYNELKALYINEPGLGCLICRSNKKQALDF